MQHVGFIGLGSQGAPMAHRIIGAGFPTTLWARRPETLTAFRQTSAVIADTPAQLAAASDLVCICVVDDAGLESVVSTGDGVLNGLRPSATVAIHSTVHPHTVQQIGDAVAARGGTLIDAPVTGGGPAAEAGTLLLIAGGDENVIDHRRPVFESFANRIVHTGGIGSAQAAKLFNNLLMTANLGAAAATLELAADFGIDSAPLTEILVHGSAASFALNVLSRFNGDVRRLADSAGALLSKDVLLARDITSTTEPTALTVFATAQTALAKMGIPSIKETLG